MGEEELEVVRRGRRVLDVRTRGIQFDTDERSGVHGRNEGGRCVSTRRSTRRAALPQTRARRREVAKDRCGVRSPELLAEGLDVLDHLGQHSWRGCSNADDHRFCRRAPVEHGCGEDVVDPFEVF